MSGVRTTIRHKVEARRGAGDRMAVATAQDLRARRERVRSSDWIRGVFFFFLCTHDRLPSDPQVLHTAFAALKEHYPDALADYRFAPDPVMLRSERLHKVLCRLQLTRNTRKPNPDMPSVQYTEQGRRAVEAHVLTKFDEQEVRRRQEAADRLAELMPTSAGV